MRKLFLVIVLLGVVAAVLAVVGPSMPPGSPFRSMGQGLRDMGDFVARGFGGGYGELGG